MVPPSAARKRPGAAPCAPVKAPRSWPNSRASSIASGRAAQLIARNGRPARGLSSCRKRAITSFPEPDGPAMRMVARVAAARRARSKRLRLRGSCATGPAAGHASRRANCRTSKPSVDSRSISAPILRSPFSTCCSGRARREGQARRARPVCWRRCCGFRDASIPESGRSWREKQKACQMRAPREGAKTGPGKRQKIGVWPAPASKA